LPQSSSSNAHLSVNRVNGNAKRRIILPLRPIDSNPVNNSTTSALLLEQQSVPTASSSTPIAIESVLIDLQKLQSPKQRVYPSVSLAPRRVHFSEEQVGGSGLKEVSESVLNICVLVYSIQSASPVRQSVHMWCS
jgi:hypothetical protein